MIFLKIIDLISVMLYNLNEIKRKWSYVLKRELIYKIFSRMPTLETERLILRKLEPSDAADMFDYAKREDVTRYLTWYPHKSESATEQYLAYISRLYGAGSFYDWAVVDKGSQRMIGTCGFTRFDFRHDSGEIGYVLNPDFWGRGLMPEAAVEVVRFGFENLLLNRIEAKHLTGNEASRRVMEKLGMTYEGVSRGAMLIKGKYRDVHTCGILRSEYEEKK